ncbi:barstar family protein [Brevundimonas sp. AAP58]|uniref:barstar family protein n=1 Tax=Brevundimonas sp. AAP58 TaxID=1523422 RepID=UPI0021009560|nr:barstar family protein [Brevundimonas sp. AAP58]
MSVRRLIIDGAKVRDMEDVYDLFVALPDIPDWVGRNPDALYDTIAMIQEPTEIDVYDLPALKQNLRSDYPVFMSILEDSVAASQKSPEYPALTLSIMDGPGLARGTGV